MRGPLGGKRIHVAQDVAWMQRAQRLSERQLVDGDFGNGFAPVVLEGCEWIDRQLARAERIDDGEVAEGGDIGTGPERKLFLAHLHSEREVPAVLDRAACAVDRGSEIHLRERRFGVAWTGTVRRDPNQAGF